MEGLGEPEGVIDMVALTDGLRVIVGELDEEPERRLVVETVFVRLTVRLVEPLPVDDASVLTVTVVDSDALMLRDLTSDDDVV